MDTFDLLLNSEKYMNAIKFIEDQSGIKIMLDYHGEYIVEQRLKERISRLDIKTNDWINVFGNDYEKILKFVVEKYNKYKDEQDDGGEFPEGERELNDEKPVTVKVLDFPKSMILSCFIEYYIIKTIPEKLLEYIKTARIPCAKKYEKEIKEIYNKIK